MNAPGGGRAAANPIGVITELVTGAEPGLGRDRAGDVIAGVAGGRAKARRLAAALAGRPGVLLDGLSPAPRAVGELLLALHRAGATHIAWPCCAGCGKQLRSLQRRGQHWYCAVCGKPPDARCGGCGNMRTVAMRGPDGAPRCPGCPVADDRDPVSVIAAVVAALDPDADASVVAAAVTGCCRQPGYQRRVAWALEADPALLTGQAHRAALRVIPRIVERLHAAGIGGITLPACPGCDRTVRIDKPLDGQRVCRRCIARSRREQCARCQAHREPVTRDETGRPVCANCFITDPVNLETCTSCGRRRPVGRRTRHGPLCPSCHSLTVETCFLCGETTPCGRSRHTGRPWCPPCQKRTATCRRCGRDRPVVAGTAAEPLCAGCAPPPAWADCPVCADPDHPKPGSCERCLTNQRLDQVMGPAGKLPEGLAALRRQIADAEHGVTANRWLTNKPTATVLSDLAAGRMPLTHAAFDQLPVRPAIEHLRQTLVAVGALPERDTELVRTEQFLTRFLAGQNNPDQRKLLHRYLHWNLLRRIRTRNNARPTTRRQFTRIRAHAHAADAFLTWLARRGLTLASCRDADLDGWLTDPDGGYRYETGTFIRWCHANKLTGIYLPATRWHGPTDPPDDQHRWDTARRLLHDTTIAAADRLAGLLLLLYAQNVSAINQLTVDQIQTNRDDVRILLGTTPILLPEPVAGIARTVIANREGHATIGAGDSRWLLPGGQPGRPISTAQLTHRLNKLGIRPNQARSTALLQLATEIPAAILARTLGIGVSAATCWQRLSAGDWAAYAAHIGSRPHDAHPGIPTV